MHTLSGLNQVYSYFMQTEKEREGGGDVEAFGLKKESVQLCYYDDEWVSLKGRFL